FWLNVSDDDALKYIKIFTTLTREEIDELARQQEADPGSRALQRRLAEEITVLVHSREDYEAAVEASQILFSNKAGEILHRIDEETLLQVMDGVPRFDIPRKALEEGVKLADLLTEHAPVFPSKGEMRKMVQGGGVSINKEKVTDPYAASSTDMLLNDKYILVQRGKKNYYLLTAV
ncbi:MAG: tyrosine--tRNA ligase, partial [Duncaniella sp.]|nr:tyrosine--tRNA ligase [Duncaniella sp.]